LLINTAIEESVLDYDLIS